MHIWMHYVQHGSAHYAWGGRLTCAHDRLRVVRTLLPAERSEAQAA